MRRWRGLLVGVLLVFYAVGIYVRDGYGILVTVRNESGMPLHHLGLKLADNRETRVVGMLSPGAQYRTFVRPVTESQLDLTFDDANKKPHTKTIVGYLEAGYCGNASAVILPNGEVLSRESISIITCWGGWFDFI